MAHAGSPALARPTSTPPSPSAMGRLRASYSDPPEPEDVPALSHLRPPTAKSAPGSSAELTQVARAQPPMPTEPAYFDAPKPPPRQPSSVVPPPAAVPLTLQPSAPTPPSAPAPPSVALSKSAPPSYAAAAPCLSPGSGVCAAKSDGSGLVLGELLPKHAGIIERLRELLSEEPLFEPARHDEVFLLRFLLSHKLDPKRAAKACRRALAIRKEQGLDELADMFRSTEWWAMLCYAMACYAMPCYPYAMLCFAMLCYAIYAMLGGTGRAAWRAR